MRTIQAEEDELAVETETAMVANWTAAEFALMRALSVQVQGTTLDQIARMLFSHEQSPLQRAEQALERLTAAGLIESHVVETHPLEQLAKPLFVWKPGDPTPNDQKLKKLSHRACSRWTLPPVVQTIYVATQYAARSFGAFVDSWRVKPCEATHNIHLAEVFVYYSVQRPRMAAMWLGEGAFPKLGFDIKGMKDPDAYLINPTGTADRVIEFAGIYSADHLANFHSHCAGSAARKLSHFCRAHRNCHLARLYAPQGTSYELMVDRLKADHRLVLEHVARYRMTTPTILAAALEESESDAASILAKLAAAGWLAAQSLDLTGAMGKCYHLSERATVKCNVNPQLAKPLRHDARVERYAIATFCCCSDSFRRVFTRDEFIAGFSHLWYPGQPLQYYLESSELKRPKLAFLKVDHGGSGRWDRLIDSCMRFLRQRIEVDRVATHHRPQTEAFAQLVNRGHFQISVLTSLPEKQRAIDLELERRRATQQACPPIRAYVVPGLFDVMFPVPSMATV